MKTNLEEIKEEEKCYVTFRVVGNKMNNGLRGSFENGDKIIALLTSIDELKEEPSGFWGIEVNGIILFKQITGYDKDSGTFTCHSLNCIYEDIYVNTGEINKVYRIIQKQGKQITYPLQV